MAGYWAGPMVAHVHRWDDEGCVQLLPAVYTHKIVLFIYKGLCVCAPRGAKASLNLLFIIVTGRAFQVPYSGLSFAWKFLHMYKHVYLENVIQAVLNIQKVSGPQKDMIMID